MGLTLPIKIFQQPEAIEAPRKASAPEGWAPTVFGHADFVIPPAGEALLPV